MSSINIPTYLYRMEKLKISMNQSIFKITKIVVFIIDEFGINYYKLFSYTRSLFITIIFWYVKMIIFENFCNG